MKRFVFGFIVGALMFILVPVGATIQEYVCYKADYKVMVNGKEYADPDLPILNYKGFTYAPFRGVMEAAGLIVNWNTELNQAEVITISQQETSIMQEVYQEVKLISLNETNKYSDWISTTELRNQYNVFYTDTLDMGNMSKPCQALLENKTTKTKISFAMPGYDYTKNQLFQITVEEDTFLMWTKITHDYYFRLSELQKLGLI